MTTNGSFTFTTKLATGATYNVTVGTQPTGQTCTVSGGMGTVGTSNVTSVMVTCSSSYSIGGTISGLSPGTVTLQNNGGDNLTVSNNGTFTFPTRLQTGQTYNVTVYKQPAGKTCAVTNGMGTVGTSNVTSVTVTCAANVGDAGPG